ncbi:hypothetical protein [Lysinibacillus xylanilyticus]
MEQGLEITGEKELALVNILCTLENYGNDIWNVLGHVWKWPDLGEEIKK